MEPLTNAVEQLDASTGMSVQQWDSMFKRLVTFVERNGNCLLSHPCKADTQLGAWVCQQRMSYSNNKMSTYRINKLKSIDFVFDIELDIEQGPKGQDARWENMFSRLVAYKDIHGHCEVPQRYQKDDKLAAWVTNQRRLWRDNNLRRNRAEKLHLIGFAFFTLNGRPSRILWDTMFKRLVSYKEKHGNCLVPHDYDKDRKLANWVVEQRTLYNDNILSVDRKNRLRSIGFVFFPQRQLTSWDAMFKRLESYKEKHGNCLVPSRFEDDKQLGYWVMNQRMIHKNNQLSNDRTNKLKSIGFIFKKGQQLDLTGDVVNNPVASKENNENCSVSTQNIHKKVTKLGRLVDNQRTANKDMPPDYAVDTLVTPNENNENCSVPSQNMHTEDIKLGRWVKNKKTADENNKLSMDCENGPEEANGCNSVFMKRQFDLCEEEWNHMFNRLKIYKEEHGDCLVPCNYKKDEQLAKWVTTQRTDFNGKKTMSHDHIKKLVWIGFVFQERGMICC